MNNNNRKNLTSQINPATMRTIGKKKNKTSRRTSKNISDPAKTRMSFDNVGEKDEVLQGNFKNLFAVFSSSFKISNETHTSEPSNNFSTSTLFTMRTFPQN
jgi:hypothetical protein